MNTRNSAGPLPLNEAVGVQMRSMPRRDTAIELALRRELHKLGLRYRVHLRGAWEPPMWPLLELGSRWFVDGLLLAPLPQHGTAPKNNSAWWASKFEENVARDRRKDDSWRSSDGSLFYV